MDHLEGVVTKNRLTDLNDHLFAQLERLGSENLSADQIEAEAKRADAIVALADQVTKNSDTMLKAARLFAEHGDRVLPLLPQIGRAEPKGGTE